MVFYQYFWKVTDQSLRSAPDAPEVKMEEKLYIVHKKLDSGKRETVGPYTADEIRNCLKQGTVLPHDLVSRTGKAVQVPVIEMDEIFEPLFELKRASGDDSIYNRPKDGSREVGRSKSRSNASTTLSKNANQRTMNFESEDTKVASFVQNQAPSHKDSMQNNRSAPSLSALVKIKDETQTARRIGRNQFYIQDRQGMQYGPFKGEDIVGFFRRGDAHKSQTVVEPKMNRTLPIQKFVYLFEQVGTKGRVLGNQNKRNHLESAKRNRINYTHFPARHAPPQGIVLRMPENPVNAFLFVLSSFLLSASFLLGSLILTDPQMKNHIYRVLGLHFERSSEQHPEKLKEDAIIKIPNSSQDVLSEEKTP